MSTTYSLWFDDGDGAAFERTGMRGRAVAAWLLGLGERIKDGERIQIHVDPEAPASAEEGS